MKRKHVNPRSPIEAIECRIEPTNRPMAYLKYEPSSRTVWTLTGYPQTWRRYDDVEVLTGLPPYGSKGFTLIAFGDVPIIHLRLTYNAHNWYERDQTYAYQARWGLVPAGQKINDTAGVCWTKSIGPVTSDGGGFGGG